MGEYEASVESQGGANKRGRRAFRKDTMSWHDEAALANEFVRVS